MKSFILILFIIGLCLMILGYTENYKNCPLPKIEYRYIPRNFYEEQIADSNLKNLYSDMFNKQEAWSRYPIGDLSDNGVTNTSNFIESVDYESVSDSE